MPPSVATIEWVVTVYLVLVSGLLLSFGRVGDLRGHGRVYMAGFGVFVVGSVLCATATTVGQLIAFHGVQALGGAMLFASVRRDPDRGLPGCRAGPGAGPSGNTDLSGLDRRTFDRRLARAAVWLAGDLSLNVPVGLIALGLSLRFVPRGVPVVHGDRFDWAGAVTFMAGLSLLLLALNRGHDWGWLTLRTLALLASAGLILALFIRLERQPGPMLDLYLSGGGSSDRDRHRDAELHLFVQHHVSAAVLSDPGPRVGYGAGRSDPDRTADCHGDRRATQRRAVRSDRVAAVEHGGHGNPGSGVVAAGDAGAGVAAEPGRPHAGSGRSGHRHLHLAQHRPR